MNDKEAILLVEDNEDDVFLMRRAIEKAGIANPLFVVEDGQQAIDYLSGTERFSDRTAFPLPALIFLDLKLPKKKGLEVLEWLRKEERLRRVVVLILTASQEPNDLRRAYDLGVNSFLVKPSKVERLEALMTAVKDYWLEFNMFDSTRG